MTTAKAVSIAWLVANRGAGQQAHQLRIRDRAAEQITLPTTAAQA
jgi:hypothetical protein